MMCFATSSKIGEECSSQAQLFFLAAESHMFHMNMFILSHRLICECPMNMCTTVIFAAAMRA